METILEVQNETRTQTSSRPFASPAFAGGLLNCTSHRVADFVHDGRIPLAFDIRHPSRHRLCLRVATANVVAFKSGLTPSSDIKTFFDTVFPPNVPTYNPPELGLVLQCNTEHIYHLITAKALTDAGDKTRYQVPRESILRFLKKRRLA
jgi:hypothetical protein